jgi:hypothetical protein
MISTTKQLLKVENTKLNLYTSFKNTMNLTNNNKFNSLYFFLLFQKTYQFKAYLLMFMIFLLVIIIKNKLANII